MVQVAHDDDASIAREGVAREMVDEVVEDHGITNINHTDFGAIPGFAIPNPEG